MTASTDSDSSQMRIVFMGTPTFAVPSLDALVDAGFKPVAVVTGPDRKRGRGQVLSGTPIKDAAIRHQISHIIQPEDVRSSEFAKDISALNPDIIVVVAFRILPEEVFGAARMGTFNLHGSLLPRYRGAAPINHAIMNGDSETGVTTFFLKQRVDTGNVILRRSMSIAENETAGEVHDRMMHLGAEAVVDTVRLMVKGELQTLAQDDSLATGAPKIFRDDCLIDFDLDASNVHNKIRGLSPSPGAFSFLETQQIKVYRTRLSKGDANVEAEGGEIIRADQSLIVACGKGTIEILELQQAGKQRMTTADFLRGNRIAPGQKFQSS